VTEPFPDPPAGGTRIGRFVLGRELGSGAFATVFLAHDEMLDDDVAIKLLSEDWVQRGDVRARFLEEARLLRRVDSRRVASVFDIGETDQGRPYLVLSLADGGTLAEVIRRGPIPLDEIVRLGAEVALGVADLHREGVLHRDLKPSNILFVSDANGGERILISDLGLAKPLELASGFTLGAGTAGYAAPEQFAPGGDLDVRADVYSLGAVVRAMLQGSRSRRWARGEKERVEAVVTKALAPDRRDRQPNAVTFAAELTAALDAARRLGRRRRVVTGLAAGVAGAAAGAAAGLQLSDPAASRYESRAAGVAFSVPEDLAGGNVGRGSWELPGQTNPASGIVVADDVDRWADPASGERGVFATIGVDAEVREGRVALVHRDCRIGRPRVASADGHEGEVVVWSDCPGGAVFHEGLFPVGGGEALLYVQAANLTDDEFDTVLGSLRLA
jgi:hypothetical protein